MTQWIQIKYRHVISRKWEFRGWTLVSLGQIYALSPSRYPTALMAPSRAAPFPAWPDSPVIHFPFPSGDGSWHPSHVGARHQRPPTGTMRPLSPPQGVRSTITTICDTGYAELPTYPVQPAAASLYQGSAGHYSSSPAASSYLEGHDVLMMLASKT